MFQQQQQTSFQPAATGSGFGLQMQPLAFQAPPQQNYFQSVYDAPTADASTFTIGLPGGFQFAADGSLPPAATAATNYGAQNNYAFYDTGASGIKTRDAALGKKKSAKKCWCC